MRCIYCGHSFSDWNVLQIHLCYHRKESKKLVLMSPKEKAKIVAKVEARLAEYIIVPTSLSAKKAEAVMEVKIVCPEDCVCVVCFHKRLDSLVQKSDEALQTVLEQHQPNTIIVAAERGEIQWQG